MLHSKPTAPILLSLFASFSSALAQSSSGSSTSDLPAPIVGCTDVSCPNDGWDSCTVADNTFVGVGLARIADIPSSLSGLSLVKGVNISESGDPDSSTHGADETRPYKSVYYLGTPSNLDNSALSGCAVVFNDPPTRHFEEPKINGSSVNVDTRAATGSCPDVIEQSCINALTRQARELDYGRAGSNSTGSGSPCDALERALRDNAPKECGDLTGAGDGLGEFSVVSLGDASEISAQQNSSSNCWPVLPKSDALLQFAEDTVRNNYTNEANLAEVYKITPILTVFTSGSGNNSLVDETSAQLTCLKVVTTQNTENAENATDADGGEDAASLSRVNVLGVTAAALGAAIFSLL
ncbi:hypothetical protein ASPCAL11672 [Aspergillus calidoustus]|uniref:Uncharacterized protein n=1 Tax=Aspergillus calidoustus TaxID=454130 RepID=A0A0U5GA55_ASPCI|nr:hypothetical protein ASPCAL11672 [Aspergillus calidoustus]